VHARKTSLSSIRLGFILLSVVAAVGCSGGLQGKYATEKNAFPDVSLDFQSGDKVIVTGIGQSTEGTYKVEGDKVIVTAQGATLNFTKNSSGDLESIPPGSTLHKVD